MRSLLFVFITLRLNNNLDMLNNQHMDPATEQVLVQVPCLVTCWLEDVECHCRCATYRQIKSYLPNIGNLFLPFFGISRLMNHQSEFVKVQEPYVNVIFVGKVKTCKDIFTCQTCWLMVYQSQWFCKRLGKDSDHGHCLVVWLLSGSSTPEKQVISNSCNGHKSGFRSHKGKNVVVFFKKCTFWI